MTSTMAVSGVAGAPPLAPPASNLGRVGDTACSPFVATATTGLSKHVAMMMVVVMMMMMAKPTTTMPTKTTMATNNYDNAYE